MKITLLTGTSPSEAYRGRGFPAGHVPGGAPWPYAGRERAAGAGVCVPAGGACRADLGRAMSDLQRMNGQLDEPQTEDDYTILTGSAPVAAMQGYPSQVAAYGKGRARLSLRLKGYEPCHNAEEVIAASGYDPEADAAHPAGSVFCAHGAGYYVPWQEVAEHMHLPWGWLPGQKQAGTRQYRTACGHAQRRRKRRADGRGLRG